MDTTEAKDALSKKEDIIEQNLEETPPIQNPELIETTEDDEWEDWDDEISNSSTTEKSLPERRIARDTTETVRPKGSRVDLHVLRSTTGRNLVSVADAPRASIGSSKVDLDSGASIEIDLGGGIVETGGRVIKDSSALESLLEEMEMILLEADMGVEAIDTVLNLLRNELIGSRLRKGANLAKVLEASLKRALRSLLRAGYWDLDETVNRLSKTEEGPVVLMVVGVNGVGKTTSVAKMAHRFTQQGLSLIHI